MAILIQNGEIVTSDSRQRADLYIENETITRIGAGLTAPPGADVVDASGKIVVNGIAYKTPSGAAKAASRRSAGTSGSSRTRVSHSPTYEYA